MSPYKFLVEILVRFHSHMLSDANSEIGKNHDLLKILNIDRVL
jgi:hypothetical protein